MINDMIQIIPANGWHVNFRDKESGEGWRKNIVCFGLCDDGSVLPMIDYEGGLIMACNKDRNFDSIIFLS